MKRKIIPFLLLLAVVSSCTPRSASSSETPAIMLEDCVLASPGVESQVDAKCGSLTVLEDPSNPTSREISLNIVVVPAIKRSPQPDPLFILAGGPGQAIVEIYPSLSSAMFRIHEDRDIILVDQRGTGKSNPLRCLDPENETLTDEEVIGLLKACPGNLDADLRYYTTDIAMQDLDRVRASLGYSSINLYGVSYGSRAALVYVKLFPQHVRSMVLDAVVDPQFILYQTAARDGQSALEQFLVRCETDDACRSTFPDLRSELDGLLQRVQDHPVDITIAHPISGKPLDLTLTRTTLANILFATLYVPELVAMLPLAIHQAYAEANYAPLVTQSYLVNADIYDGMFYAVACAEDAPLISSEQIDGQSLFGESARMFLEVCSAWPASEPPAVVHAALESDVPVLMLSGGADPITPPHHAEQLAQSLGNDLHLVFEHMGHGNSNTQCTVRIIDAFIESASVSGLDTSCVEQIQPPPFFVDFSGPRP